MKTLFLCFMIFLPILLSAQADSVSVSYSEEKVEKFEKTTLIDEYEKAFGGNRLLKSALRLNFSRNPFWNMPDFSLFNAINTHDKSMIQMQFEQKIDVDKSLIAGLDWSNSDFPINLNVEMEGRWYYKMKNRVKAGIQQPNITGKYLSLRVELKPFHNLEDKRFPNNTTYSTESIFKANATYSLNWGIQFGNNVNYGLSLGIKQGKERTGEYRFNNRNKETTWFITTNTPVGIGLYFPRKKKIKYDYCEFLQCNYEVKQLFKLNLANAFYVDKYLQTFVLDLGYERKLGYSPFSLNTNVIGGYIKNYIYTQAIGLDPLVPSFPAVPIEKKYYIGYGYEINEQLRYYLGMNKKIIKGVSAGNLNGIYIGLSGGYRASRTNDLINVKSFINYKSENLRGGFVVGYQIQSNRQSFFDINAAFCQQSYKYTSDYHSAKGGGQGYLQLSLKLGIAR